MIYYWIGWRSIPDSITIGLISDSPQIKITVIVPARNEEKNIDLLLRSLEQQSYSKTLIEIIVVDDHSEDKTAEIVKKFPDTKLISLSDTNLNSYKKRAIESGIAAAAGELIITTDADCSAPAKWIETIAAFQKEKNAVFIAAPVVYNNNSSLLEIFQALDFLVLQGITGVSVYKNFLSMCNGANLAYERKIFYEVNGFSGIDKIASGDDLLLMHKIWKKYPQQVHYLKSKDAIINTQPMKTWKDFFNQRIRWASKAKHYDDKRILWILILVYIFNLFFPALLIAGFWNYTYWLYLLGLWIAKTLIEFPFVAAVASFFDKKSLLKYFFFLQPLHIGYTIISGFLGQFGKYEWKGRKVK